MKKRVHAPLLVLAIAVFGEGFVAKSATNAAPSPNRIADLSVAKIASPDPAHLDQNLVYSIQVHNNGPSFAPSASMQDTLPDNVTVVSVSAPSGSNCFTVGKSLQCSVPMLLSGETRHFGFVVKPTSGNSVTNMVVVTDTQSTDPNPSNNSATITTEVLPASIFGGFLHGADVLANPPVLVLDGYPPSLISESRYKDSGTVQAGLTNPWVEVGAWPAQPGFFEGTLTALGNLRVWLGLKNSDDLGTQFALRVEVWKNGQELVASGETPCVAGLLRDPARVQEAKVALTVFQPVAFDGVSDVLSLKVLTRIGTGCPGPGHAAATGLRLYFDGLRTPSAF